MPVLLQAIGILLVIVGMTLYAWALISANPDDLFDSEETPIDT